VPNGSDCDLSDLERHFEEMTVTQQNIDALAQELRRLVKETDAYFEHVDAATQAGHAAESSSTHSFDRRIDADFIPDKDRNDLVPKLSADLGRLVLKIVEVSKATPLVSEVDHKDLRLALRRMLAALRICRYQHWETNVVTDEDRVVGVEPAGQVESPSTVSDSQREFHAAADEVGRILGLIFPSDTPVATALAQSQTPEIKRYRPNTAFIMMWISKDHPELDDVKDCMKEVFKRYGITAVRSDEIEHSGVITDRILHEIATSEFLIADLTGERPSVYYEVGYAHALGKRPILYRHEGTRLHFDLSVHNRPEYKNISDLREKLNARLAILTNRNAAEPDAGAAAAEKEGEVVPRSARI
jgi:hypothetical protein